VTAVVEVRGLGFEIGEAVLLKDVDIDVRSGEVLGVIGPNGAGKSTLLRMLAGELTPTSGSVAYNGRDLGDFDLEELAQLRCLLPQQHVLRFGFSCLDVVLMGRYPHDESPSESTAVARRVMEQTDTEHLSQRRYPTLSGGEQARVAFARVMAQDTPVMLLDEPTANLDLRHQQIIMKVARQHAATGSAVVAVLHDVNLAARFADRLIVLESGSLHASGSPADVLTEDLLGRVYDLDVSVIAHPEDGRPLVVPRDAG
jgi:iron complex transport system ATP-binding protein